MRWIVKENYMIVASPKAILLALAAGFMVLACNPSDFKGDTPQKRPVYTKTHTQDAYPERTKSFIQSYLGDPQTDEFTQGTWGQLDLLVVVDNSGSMAEEQANLAPKLQPLLSKVQQSDWRIGVTTTDAGDPCLIDVINKGDRDAEGRFRRAVSAGTNGDGIERGLFKAVSGLQGACRAAPWLRADSTVAVLIVSDEDNCHIDNDFGYGCSGAADLSAGYLLDYLEQIREPGETARVYGLLWHPTTPEVDCGDALKTGDTYADVIDETKGKWGSICDDDYTSTLTAISEDVAQILAYEFDLSQSPNDGSLQVQVDGQDWLDFTIDGQKVKFTQPPPFGASIAVSYRFGGDQELREQFDLEGEAVDGSLTVAVDSETTEQFAYDGGFVSFSDAPQEEAKIDVTFLEKIELEKTFEVADTADPETIVVFVNGVRVTEFSFDAATGSITFAEAPAAEAEIRISYKRL